MNWQEDLLRKSQELNLEGGNNDSIPSRDGSRNIPRSRNSDRSNVSIKKRKDLNKNSGKEEELMITREAALDDLNRYEKEAEGVGKVIIKVAKVFVKILCSMRSNQLLTDTDKDKIKTERESHKQEGEKVEE